MAKTLDAAGVKRLIQEIKGANNNLNAPIPISTENTPESMAQNVKNIADYVEKAKAAGIADVNGMAVTCIIAGNYSGVGYLYGEDMICGTTTYDDLSTPYNFVVQPDGLYTYNPFIVKGTIGQVTSDMLVEGARNPIILTPDTTEVDEETYQKLLSDDVDVVFKDAYNILYYLFDVDKNVSVNDIEIRFINTSGSIDTAEPSDYYFSVVSVEISKNTPHTVTTEFGEHSLLDILDYSGYLNKSTLSPVLQEIDLTGTDAERKAKLDQFETDWKALTGADDLTGARFVGKFGITDDVERNVTGIMTYSAGDAANDATDNCFYGICNGYSFSEQKSQIAVKVSCTNGTLTITPLFSHLEAIKIYDDEVDVADGYAQNLKNITAYKRNLEALGVDTSKPYIIPIGLWFDSAGIFKDTGFLQGPMPIEGRYQGYVNGKLIYINATTGEPSFEYLVIDTKISPIFEAITIYTDNTPEHMQANLDNIAAYEANLQALGVDTTKGWNAPVKVNAINGISSGIFASTGENTNTPYTIISGLVGEYPYIIRIKTSGVSTMWEILCDGRNYTRITTTAKSIISAINEINANAVHKDKFVPTLEAIAIKIGNTPEDKAANIAAIKAYVDNLIALGVDVTKGYMIPVKLTNGYHGFIMGTDADGGHTGIIKRNTFNYGGGWIFIDNIGTYQYLECLTVGSYDNLTTTAKTIIPAINEVNALAKGYSTPIELTTETAQNKTAIDARVAAFTAQGISLTNGCCIPVTYKGVYAGNISLINGDWYGLLVKNTNNPADNINIKLSADGTITEGNSAQ